MSLYLPTSALLREPNLLIPGGKPVGPIKANLSDPLCPDLWWLMHGNRVVELIGNRPATSEGGISIGTLVDGRQRPLGPFDGSGYVDTGVYPGQGQHITLVGWVYRIKDSYQTLISNQNSSTEETGIFWNTNNYIYFIAHNLKTGFRYSIAHDLNATGWHHLAMTWDGTQGVWANTSAWLDGVALTLSQSGTAPTGSAYLGSTFKLGYRASTANANGTYLDDVRMYYRELSESEIQGIVAKHHYPVLPA